MSKRKDVDLIRDINESMERIISFTCNIEYNNFAHDYKTQDAVIRNIEIMGEAAKSLSEKQKQIILIFHGRTLLEQETN